MKIQAAIALLASGVVLTTGVALVRSAQGSDADSERVGSAAVTSPAVQPGGFKEIGRITDEDPDGVVRFTGDREIRVTELCPPPGQARSAKPAAPEQSLGASGVAFSVDGIGGGLSPCNGRGSTLTQSYGSGAHVVRAEVMSEAFADFLPDDWAIIVSEAAPPTYSNAQERYLVEREARVIFERTSASDTALVDKAPGIATGPAAVQVACTGSGSLLVEFGGTVDRYRCDGSDIPFFIPGSPFSDRLVAVPSELVGPYSIRVLQELSRTERAAALADDQSRRSAMSAAI